MNIISSIKPIVDRIWMSKLPKPSGVVMTGAEIQKILDANDIPVPLRNLDSEYYVLNEWGYNQIIPYISHPAQDFVPEKQDCDWFAFNAFVKAQEYFGINGIGVAIGPSMLGYHAYNFVILDTGAIMYFEPQKGGLVPNRLLTIGVNYYTVDKVVI